MSGHRPWAEIRKERGAEAQARMARYRVEMLEAASLAELRRARALTQAQLGEALEMPQSAVSRLERQADLYVSTLRRYIEAMGGALHLEAVFPDARIPIARFGSLVEPADTDGDPPLGDAPNPGNSVVERVVSGGPS